MFLVSAELTTASVSCQNQVCNWKVGVLDPTALAYGVFNDTTEETGWGILNITAGHIETKGYSNEDIMFSAGVLEGVLTQK